MDKQINLLHKDILKLTEATSDEKTFMVTFQRFMLKFMNFCKNEPLISFYNIINIESHAMAKQIFMLTSNGRVAKSLKLENTPISKDFLDILCSAKTLESKLDFPENEQKLFFLLDDSNVRIYPITINSKCWGFIILESNNGEFAKFDIVLEIIMNILRNFITSQETKSKLKKSELKYKEIAEMLPEIIFETNINGTLKFLNKDGYNAFGLNHNTDISKINLIKLFDKDNQAIVKSIFNICINEEKQSITQDLYGISEDGHKFPVILRINSVKNGKVSGTRGIMINIAERKNLEDKIFDEHKKMLSIFNSIDEPIFVQRFDTNEILFANDFLLNFFNNTLIGNTCQYAMHNRTDICDNCCNHLVTPDTNEIVKSEYFDKTSGLYYLINQKTINWIDGTKVRFKLSINITDQKIALKQLEYEKTKYEGLINLIPEPVVACDCNYNIIYANQPFVDLIRKNTYDECLGMNISNIFTNKTDFIGFKNLINKEKTINNAEFKMIDSNNIEFLTSISASKHTEGKDTHMICVINDITKKRNIEAFLTLNNNIDKLIESNSNLADSLSKIKTTDNE